MSFVNSSDTGITAINNVLVQEANRINEDIYRRTVHTSPWIDLIKQTAFRDGQGYQQTTLVYDRAIPTTGTNGNTAGVTWHDIALVEAANTFNTSLPDYTTTPRKNNPLAGATREIAGQSGADTDASGAMDNDARSYINFSRQLKQYTLKRAIVESPKISLEDLRFAAFRQEQIRAIMDLMTEAVRYTWENRYRDEFDRVADNLVLAKSGASSGPVSLFVTGREGYTSESYDPDTLPTDDGTVDINANISNALLDKIYNQMVRKGAASEAYGRENGRPVFALVCSSNASRSLQIESEYRDDVRYNNAKVSELIAPLGVEKSFRGFYHLIDDLAPRYTAGSGGDSLTRVLPYTVTNGITSVNSAYEDAPYEAAFVIHPHVCESQIPNPFSGAGAIKFNPVNYRGQFKWTNIPDAIRNPDGTVGFFRGVLASATRPIKTDFGYTIIFQRTATANAVV